MDRKELTYFLSGSIGAVVGFALAKIYQIWAILYELEGRMMDGLTSWEGKQLWLLVVENQGITTLIVTMFFTALALLFNYLFQKGKQ